MHAHKVEKTEMMLIQITVPFLCCLENCIFWLSHTKNFSFLIEEETIKHSRPLLPWKYQILKSKINLFPDFREKLYERHLQILKETNLNIFKWFFSIYINGLPWNQWLGWHLFSQKKLIFLLGSNFLHIHM